MSKEENIKLLIDEYRTKKELFHDFAIEVKSIVESILKNESFAHQPVTCREKDPDSLKKKLEAGKVGAKNLLEIDDLSGCRVIFYTDHIDKFANLLFKEFNVEKHNLKFSTDGYNASHLIIKLKEDLLKSAKYQRFAGLKCEIQLTTVLYHAWSEMAHDSTYKPDDEIKRFDSYTFESIQKRLADTMKNHIKEAQYTFDFIVKEIQKIKEGKKIFDESFLQSVLDSKSNNELYENLKLLFKYIEEFGDKTPEHLNAAKIIRAVITKARNTEIKPMQTPFGKLSGHSYKNVAIVCLDIIDRLRFHRPKEAFDLLSEIAEDTDTDIKEKALKIFEHFAQYDFRALKQIGYQMQILLLEKIETWNDVETLKRFDLAVEAVGHFLDPSFGGSQMTDYKTITFSSGALHPDKPLLEIRKRVLTLGKKLYSLTKNVSRREKVLKRLQQASYTSDRGAKNDDMEKVIIENTNELIDFYISILPSAENEIIKEIEEQSYWLIRRFKRESFSRISELEALVHSNHGYQMYRVLVGYDGRFDEGRDWGKAAKTRNDQISQYMKNITKTNLAEWKLKILAIIKNYSSVEPGEFQYFNRFLFELGKQKPDLALQLIDMSELEPFLIHIIAGIWSSPQKKKAKRIVREWTVAGKHLSTSARLFDYVEEIDGKLLSKIFTKAKAKKNLQALNNITGSIVRNYPKHKETRALFIKTLKELTKNKNYWWIQNVWFRGESILKDFSDKNFDILLENLLMFPNIDYHVEEVLMPLAEKYPEKIIDFFYKRVEIKTKRERNLYDRYDAVPFNFHKLNAILRQNEARIIPTLLAWFSKGGKKNKWLFRWEASHLMEEIFSSFSPIFEQSLIDLVNNKGKDGLDIVLSIINKRKGEDFLFDIVKAIAEKYHGHAKYDEIQGSLFGSMSQTGVVMGEDGFVRAYEAKKVEIQKLKTDPLATVKNFAVEYEKYLNIRIMHERKRAEESVEIRKREFNP